MRPGVRTPRGLLGGIVVETPATRSGSRYAWIPIQAFRGLSAGPLKLFALLSGLHRPRKAIVLSAAECVASLGCCERSLRYWRRELEREGWVAPRRLTIRRSRRLGKGYRARVDVRRLSVMPPASLRAYVAVMFATRDGVRQQTYEAIARTLGRSRQALGAALKGVRAELKGVRAERAPRRGRGVPPESHRVVEGGTRGTTDAEAATVHVERQLLLELRMVVAAMGWDRAREIARTLNIPHADGEKPSDEWLVELGIRGFFGAVGYEARED